MVRNYFELFGLPARFDIDPGDLAARHRERIRIWHPDRYAQGTSEERRRAVAMSADLNDGLKILRNPVARARHLLALRGISTDEETDTAMDGDFLMEQMAWRERLEEGAGRADEVAALADEVATSREGKEARLAATLGQGDAADLDEARMLVRELQFLERFLKELDDAVTEVP
ncbi:Fe-S protein assembly co-chaperone HscB [Acidiferrobacter sp.]|uniref:Fe-S protein assembly co-chaperone HscB n=1 Tax=Acidiferrobacter sp. TaxID=1872107 RepID=UPI00261B2658|nr:Fe-S protein assembly co-chaperone HscB [Acidiferrobacter sp.]